MQSILLIGILANIQTRGQSSRGLDNA